MNVRYVAILKDSFLEAIDTKVFYVMMALSGVLILLIASLGFTPRPASELSSEVEESLNIDVAGLVNAFKKRDFKPPPTDFPATFKMASVDALDGPLDRPSSNLRFLVRARYPNAMEAGKAKKTPALTEQFISKRFASYGDNRFLNVTEVKLGAAPASLAAEPDPNDVYFEVITHPTGYTVAAWPHDMTVLFGAFKMPLDTPQPVGVLVLFIEQILVNWAGASVAILVSVVITGFFIPNMLRKGTIDMLLVKPIHRWTLLLYKYLGGLTFIFLNTTLAIGGVWLAFGLRTGLWAPGLLLMIFITTFYFAILYAVSTFFAVLTRSPIVAILISCFAWFIFWLAGQAYVGVDYYVKEGKIPDGWYVSVVNGIHYILPRPGDLNRLSAQVLQSDLAPKFAVLEEQMKVAPINWRESLTVSVVFIAVMLGLACFRFSTRDY